MVPGKFPLLYPILDAGFLPQDLALRSEMLVRLVGGLAEAGVGILQYRNKQGDVAEILRDAAAIQSSAPPHLRLILNDYSHLVAPTGFHGLHLGQTDMPPRRARDLLGPEAIIGLSTHNEAQLRVAVGEPVDYIAIGPVFATNSKANPDPVIGLDGVRLARRLANVPVIAIGGITLSSAPMVWGAGADSLAVISAIFGAGVDAAKAATAFLRAVEQLQPSVH